jgi:hypothetical protein
LSGGLVATNGPGDCSIIWTICSTANIQKRRVPPAGPVTAKVIDKSLAVDAPEKAQLAYESKFKQITLTVHSSLDAVGLTAAVATKLSSYGISANVVAAYYHDHIFVQSEKADEALSALKEFGEVEN